MLVNLKPLLIPARHHGYAVGAFNIFNLETVHAVFRAALELDRPVIFAFGERDIEVANLGIVAAMVREFAGRTVRPMALHLDHCKSIGVIRKAIQAGFTSVMFDGSGLPFDENLARTRQVVELAHDVDVTVEAELGSVPFDGPSDEVPEEALTRADEAACFAAETGVDALAIAVGTAHGEYRGRPKIHHDRLEQIASVVPIPLVLHGGSGIPEEDVLRAVRAGIAKINVNTQVSTVAVARLKALCAREKPGHLSGLLHEAESVMTEEVKRHMTLFADGKPPEFQPLP